MTEEEMTEIITQSCGICGKKAKSEKGELPNNEWAIILGTVTCDECTERIAIYMDRLEGDSR